MTKSFDLGGGKLWTPADHTSEREPGRWTNCVPATLVDLARANLVDAPSTNAEADALRKQAGYPAQGPTGLVGFRKTFRVRYGFFYALGQPNDPMVPLQPGWACSITGSMAAFPRVHTLRRWDRDFAGIHQWFAAHLPDGRVIIDDPLAPEGAGYFGQVISKDQLRAFYEKAGSLRRIGYIKSGKELPNSIPTPPEPIPTPTPPIVVVPPEVTYTQAEVDRMVDDAVSATKDSAFVAYREE